MIVQTRETGSDHSRSYGLDSGSDRDRYGKDVINEQRGAGD